jgi:hypothetical protein
MATFVLRVWLPDRPGALGEVASCIGTVHGDVVGIDILERGGGRAIDELVVEIPDEPVVVDLLVAEVSRLDGVDVEELRPIGDAGHDPRLDALEAAAIIVGARERDALVDALAAHARRVPGGDWSAVVSLARHGAEAAVVCGSAPATEWVTAFVEGSRSSARVASGESGPDDVIWAPLPASLLAVAVGRATTPYRGRERRQLAALARIADTRLHELGRARARAIHPSGR